MHGICTFCRHLQVQDKIHGQGADAVQDHMSEVSAGIMIMLSQAISEYESLAQTLAREPPSIGQPLTLGMC